MPKVPTLRPRLQSAPVRLQTVAAPSWRTGKLTSGQRGYGYRWQKARASYLLKHPLCCYCCRAAGIEAIAYMDILAECTAKGITVPAEAKVVDHKIPHRGDMTLFWDSSNWQGLCTTCHSSVKQREESDA